ALFVARAAVLFVFLTVVELVAVPAFGLLLLGPGLGGGFPELLAVLALGNLGVAALGGLVFCLGAAPAARPGSRRGLSRAAGRAGARHPGRGRRGSARVRPGGGDARPRADRADP